ncbi:MAG: PilZ domain-containing protein [Desulfarculaceae bacterium]|jgi:hypothetical protein
MVEISIDSGLVDLPSQQELRSICLRPGRAVDLIIEADLDQNLTDVRASYLHELETREGKEQLILAQTSPPLRPSQVGADLEVTFLNRNIKVSGGEWFRVGYEAVILELRRNYRLSSGEIETVIVVSGPQRFERLTLRLSYRVEPPLDYDLRLFLSPNRKKVNVLDLSMGGVKFVHQSARTFKKGQKLNLLLADEDREVNLKAEVVRTGESLPGSRRGRSATAVQFIELEPYTRETLREIFVELSRYLLAKRSGILEEG